MSSCFLGLPLPIALVPPSPLTDDQLIQFSQANKPCKIERNRGGEIVVRTPMGGLGSTHEAFVGAALYFWNENEGRSMAFMAKAGFNLPDGSCLSPDGAWLSLPRWRALTPQQQAGYPQLCPEFVIEIRSQSDPRSAVEARMALWLENGAELAWLIDPIAGDVVLYQAQGPPHRVQRPEALLGTGPVAGFELRTARLWTEGQ